MLILEKALTLDLAHFEDSEFYDKMTRARREASSRPLSLVSTFKLVQDGLSYYLRWFAATFLSLGGSASLGSRACLRSRKEAFRLFLAPQKRGNRTI